MELNGPISSRVTTGTNYVSHGNVANKFTTDFKFELSRDLHLLFATTYWTVVSSCILFCHFYTVKMAAARQVLAALVVDELVNRGDSDEEEQRLARIPFSIQEMSERNLFQKTRLDRRVFNYVLEVLTPSLERNTRRGRYEHLTPTHKLYVALQFYASGGFQWLVGGSSRISQSAVSNAISEVTSALVAVSQQFIRFPTAREFTEVKQAFYQLGLTQHGVGFPNVLGVIDCTHCRVQAPSNAPEQYFNRHLYHSINVQLIAGPDLKIYNVFAEFPGSNHDSYIWRNSAVRNAFEEGGTFPEGWLVADSGYPQEPWIMTPVANATSPAEHLYNSVHISTRNPIERTNGVLKSRWRVLDRPLAYEPGKVCQIIAACCVLHNICIQYNLDVDDFEDHPLPDDLQPCHGAIPGNYMDIRRDLIARHFTR
jgi:hypothetical protein